MNFQNISSNYSDLYIFTRNEQGKQDIQLVNNYSAYYYEPNKEGQFEAFDGKKLTKVFSSKPYLMKKEASGFAYESDLSFEKKYILDKIPSFDKCPTKIVFMDIEVQCKELPRPKETKCAKDPLSCVTCYDNFTKKYTTFFIKDYRTEFQLLEDLTKYLKETAPDLLVGWNLVDFDYAYLFYRMPGFEKLISPIGKDRWSPDMLYPAGISIIDMLGLYWKYTLGKKDSYALNNVAQDELGMEDFGETDFENDLEKVKEKNILDVKKMVMLEEKFHLFDYFDEARRLSHCLWEDLQPMRINNRLQSNNSRVIEMLALQEGKRLGKVLPNKNKLIEGEEREEFEGAFREAFELGLHQNLGKVDLSGAYPQAIIDFCLDPANIYEEKVQNSIQIDIISRATGLKTHTYWVKQDKMAIVPSLMQRMLNLKNELKAKLKETNKETEEYKQLEVAYDARKALTNSVFGVCGLPFFRLYDRRVAETITFLIRDLLHYIEDKLRENNIPLVYVDTDSAFVKNKEDLTTQLNAWVQDWSVERYGIKTKIKFDFEGYFKSIFVLAKCRYVGDLVTANGAKREVKGVEMKRRDSSSYLKNFQEILIDKLLNGEIKENILVYVKEAIEKFPTIPFEEIAIPAKIAKDNYKNKPIWIRAIENTQKIVSEFKPLLGNKFYYIYVTTENEVLAFDTQTKNHITSDIVNWPKMLERNILNKIQIIFEPLNWGLEFLQIAKGKGLKLTKADRENALAYLKNTPEYEKLLIDFTPTKKKTVKKFDKSSKL